MTERLADISARIQGIHQLGAVVNAMKGIAAARAHSARTQIDAVDSYAAIIAAALVSAVGPNAKASEKKFKTEQEQPGLLVFGAEQGFAGAFSERVLDSLRAKIDHKHLFLIGTRGISIAAARGITPVWSAALPSHTVGIPKLAEGITIAIYRAVVEGRIDCVDAVFTGWGSGRPVIVRQSIFPIELSDLPPVRGARPLTQLSADKLIETLGKDYFHALVCKAALHAFSAENEARMAAMSAAGNQIACELETFQARLRRVRQEEITAEIIELSTGAASGALSD
jgi:F-type H+-transporting ATPase subunit gamma